MHRRLLMKKALCHMMIDIVYYGEEEASITI